MTIEDTAVAVSTSKGFDWRAFVKANKPGQDSELQSQRQSVYLRVLPDLERWSAVCGLNVGEWSAIYGCHLAKGRVKSCAYYGACGVESIDYDISLLLAKVCFGLFALDIRLDDSLSVSCLDARAMQIISPFKEQLTQQQTILNFLPDLPSILNKEEDDDLDRRLALALKDIFSSLKQACSKRLSSSEMEFCLSKFVNQIVAIIKAMHWERKQSLLLQHALSLNPAQNLQVTLEEYLEVGGISIGYWVLASALVAFESVPQESWVRWQKAMKYGGRIARLANDLATALREMGESKINAVSIVLSDLGFNPSGIYGLDSPEFREAQRIVKKQLEAELICFNQQLKFLPMKGSLAYHTLSSVAFALAMYEKGDFVIDN